MLTGLLRDCYEAVVWSGYGGTLCGTFSGLEKAQVRKREGLP
jgi:hypothetical protein